jgi:hypothetical protein
MGHNDAMEFPIKMTVSSAFPPQRGGRAVAVWTVAVTIIRSLVLAAGGGYVFYASIRPVSLQEGYGSVLFDFPWIMAYLGLAAAWAVGPVVLLVLGLIHLLRHARHRWWSAACWLTMLAAGVATGFLIMHGYRLLFSAYPTDIAGEPLGPSRWAPDRPYWLALVAAGGELAVGAVMIALVNVSTGKLHAGFGSRVIEPGAEWIGGDHDLGG